MFMKEWYQLWKDLFHEQAVPGERPPRPLPLALSRRFRYAVLTCRDTAFLLAEDAHADTPRNYKQYGNQLERLLGLPVLFCLRKLPSYQYKRMIQAEVPFMTREGYVYIPRLLLHVQPHRAQVPLSSVRRSHLSPAAQVLLLRHLLMHDVHGLSLRQLAAKLPYAAMSLSNAKGELEGKGLCTYTHGCLELPLSDAELWSKARPYLKSPVQKRRYIRGACYLLNTIPLAGETALSRLSLLVDDGLPTYAVGKGQMQAFLAQPGLEETCEEDASAAVEHWRYSPATLMAAGAGCVDPLSLYLSLRDSADDRVRQELHKLPLP